MTRYRVDTDTGRRRKVVAYEGVEGYIIEFTEACTGCFEGGDYMGLAHHYGYDQKANCYVGAGCEECGYTGKRRRREWVPFPDQEAAWCRLMSQGHPAQPAGAA